MTAIVIVNAYLTFPDKEAEVVVPALQEWDDTMLAPAWGFDKCTYHFQPWKDWHEKPVPDAWPIFLNRHSTDAGVLGYHDNTTLIYGRCFIGDCIRDGISWAVDVSHEAAEMRGDPKVDKTFKMANGDIAMYELCDAVEDDANAIEVKGVKLSDFVLPSYFSTAAPPPYDYQKKLTGRCPTLTPGGYMSIYNGKVWTQVTARLIGGRTSIRSDRYSTRHRVPRIP